MLDKFIFLDDVGLEYFENTIHWGKLSCLRCWVDESVIPKRFGGKAEEFRHFRRISSKISDDTSTNCTSKYIFSLQMQGSTLEKKTSIESYKEKIKIANIGLADLEIELEELREERKLLESELEFFKKIDLTKKIDWGNERSLSQETKNLFWKFQKAKKENTELKSSLEINLNLELPLKIN